MRGWSRCVERHSVVRRARRSMCERCHVECEDRRRAPAFRCGRRRIHVIIVNVLVGARVVAVLVNVNVVVVVMIDIESDRDDRAIRSMRVIVVVRGEMEAGQHLDGEEPEEHRQQRDSAAMAT